MQQLTILGHLGKDAVIRDTNGNKAIGFSVAVSEKFKNAQDQQVEQTTWYNCTIWRTAQQGTKIADYLKKGQQVLIQGKPRARGYQSQQDSKIYGEIEVRVDKIELVGAAKPAAGGPVIVDEEQQGLGAHRDARPAGPRVATDDDNDLPF